MIEARGFASQPEPVVVGQVRHYPTEFVTAAPPHFAILGLIGSVFVPKEKLY